MTNSLSESPRCEFQPADQPSQVPVVIVGGGPIGIELAVALKRRNIECQIIEAGAIGHTIGWWAPQTQWFSSNERISIAGVPLMTVDGSKARREEYLTYLRGIVAQFQLNLRTFDRVKSIVPSPQGGFVVTSNRQVTCQRVVLAVGGTDFPKKLGIPGDDLPHVDGYLREPHRYAGRRVLIIGGRNSAVEAALRLHHAGAKVALSYRQPGLPTGSIKYWLTPEILGLIDAGRITAHFDTVAVSITPGQVTLSRADDSGTFQVDADDVLSLIGYEQEKSLFHAAGIQLVDTTLRPQHDPDTMQTNVDGIYVAGTAVAGTQTSKYRTFLENCHQHVDRITAHLLGESVHQQDKAYAGQIEAQPES